MLGEAMLPVVSNATTSPQASRRSLTDRLNAEWHKPALILFTIVVLAHWCEHLAQTFEVYVLGWPIAEARGLLGMPFPWLVSSESMSYACALFTLVALWILRLGFVGSAYKGWVGAFWIQGWVALEPAL